jgi:hypothetical protein
LRIFNAAGELVAAVAEGLGLYQVPMALKALNPAFAPDEGQQGMVELSGTGLIQAWNGRGDNGQLVESGTYTAQLAVRDGFGRVTTFMTALQVLRQSNRILLQIYNSAGERVRQAGLTMTAGTLPALDSLALDRDSFLPGAGQDLKISFGNGAGNFWFWDGNSDSGQAVRSGIYMIKVSAADSSGGPRTYSRTVTVLGLPGPNLSKAAAFPNPVAGGQAMVIRLAGPGQTLAPGIRVEASCHNLGGEMVSRADNGADPGFVTFDTRGMASGIYLVSLRRMGQEAGGGTTILKIAVFK